jgi:hypothetical protein
MHQLATLTTTDITGKSVLIRADDVRRAWEDGNGSKVLFYDGTTQVLAITVADLQTAINALWDEFTTALGDPA